MTIFPRSNLVITKELGYNLWSIISTPTYSLAWGWTRLSLCSLHSLLCLLNTDIPKISLLDLPSSSSHCHSKQSFGMPGHLSLPPLSSTSASSQLTRWMALPYLALTWPLWKPTETLERSLSTITGFRSGQKASQSDGGTKLRKSASTPLPMVTGPEAGTGNRTPSSRFQA